MSCSRTQHGGGRSRTPDLSLRSPTLYHWATALPYCFTVSLIRAPIKLNQGKQVEFSYYASSFHTSLYVVLLSILFQEFLRPLLFGIPSTSRRLEQLEKSLHETLTKVNDTLVSVQDALTRQQEKLQMISHDIYSKTVSTVIIKPRHVKTCFSHMGTTNVQIILRIRAVWSAPLLFAS